jgi:hypothetical protein
MSRKTFTRIFNNKKQVRCFFLGIMNSYLNSIGMKKRNITFRLYTISSFFSSSSFSSVYANKCKHNRTFLNNKHRILKMSSFRYLHIFFWFISWTVLQQIITIGWDLTRKYDENWVEDKPREEMFLTKLNLNKKYSLRMNNSF